MMCRVRLLLGLMTAVLVPAVGQAQYLETRLSVGRGPYDLLWNPTSNKVYCANCTDQTVAVIDGATNQLLATIPVGDFPISLDWNSVENKVYCLCPEDNLVYVIDCWGDSLLAQITVPDYPTQAAYCATENKLYVSRSDAGSLMVIDGHSDSMIRQVQIARDGPALLLWHPATNRLFCAVVPYESVKVIDCASDEVVARNPAHGMPLQWCHNPANQLV